MGLLPVADQTLPPPAPGGSTTGPTSQRDLLRAVSSTGLVKKDPRVALRVFLHFLLMCVTFSLNHGAVSAAVYVVSFWWTP